MDVDGDRFASVQIVASLMPHGGGPSYSVPALARAMAARGAHVQTRCLEGEVTAARPAWWRHNTHKRSTMPLMGLIGASRPLLRALEADARRKAVLHTHGLWLMPNVYPAAVKRQLGDDVRIVHSTRGMLGTAALKISAHKKRLFWSLYQRAALEAADCIHATAYSEYQEIRGAGLRNPVCIIPNGIDLPTLCKPKEIKAERVVLFLGRIHPKKGLDSLLKAWSQVEGEFDTWRLRIVGPSEVNHDQELWKLAHRLGLQRVAIEPPLYGEEKYAALRDAELFVLPTLNENFGIAAAEALAAELPVISTKGAPWAGLETERCGWWIEHGPEPLATALREAMTTPLANLRSMGGRGRNWMARDFAWDKIAVDMLEVYSWLKGGGVAPATVQVT
jgi:glycosyltransferase involved in cell wall biosynthesis